MAVQISDYPVFGQARQVYVTVIHESKAHERGMYHCVLGIYPSRADWIARRYEIATVDMDVNLSVVARPFDGDSKVVTRRKLWQWLRQRAPRTDETGNVVSGDIDLRGSNVTDILQD